MYHAQARGQPPPRGLLYSRSLIKPVQQQLGALSVTRMFLELNGKIEVEREVALLRVGGESTSVGFSTLTRLCSCKYHEIGCPGLRVLRWSRADGRTSNRVVVRISMAESGNNTEWRCENLRRSSIPSQPANTNEVLEESLARFKPTQTDTLEGSR